MSENLPGHIRRLSEEEEPSGVSVRTALLVILVTLFALFVLYELINWRPTLLNGSPAGPRVIRTGY